MIAKMLKKIKQYFIFCVTELIAKMKNPNKIKDSIFRILCEVNSHWAVNIFKKTQYLIFCAN